MKEFKYVAHNNIDSKTCFTEKELIKYYIKYNSGHFGIYEDLQEKKANDFLNSEYYKKIIEYKKNK